MIICLILNSFVYLNREKYVLCNPSTKHLQKKWSLGYDAALGIGTMIPVHWDRNNIKRFVMCIKTVGTKLECESVHSTRQHIEPTTRE